MWWSDWYKTASGAVSASIETAQSAVGGLFREPAIGASVYQPDDVSSSEAVRARASGTPWDLFPVDATYPPVSTDLQQSTLTRLPTWDEMSIWQKAKAYVGIIPGAAADTVGLGREGAATPATTAAAAGETVAKTAESVGKVAGGLVSSTVGSALGLGSGGVGGFVSSTLVKVIIGLVVIVVGLYFVNRIASR